MTQHYITVSGCGGYSADSTESLLEAGLRAGFGFPSACRNGNCLRCQGSLLAGSVTLRNGRTIQAGEAAAAQVLYCVAHAQEPCEINVPDITAPGQLPVIEAACQITDITPLNHDVSRVILKLPAGKAVQWYAGQYLELLLPQGPSAFSIANARSGDGRDLELHVRHTADNPSSLEVMQHLRDNPVVRTRLPGGERWISDTLPDGPVWFICGSTGFAPAKAMIEHLLTRRFPHAIYLYWGARTEADIYLPELAEAWASAGQVHYVPVLSDTADTRYRTGLVHEAALADMTDPAGAECHVGGSPVMAWAVFDALLAAGVPAANIHSDVFDYAPRQ
ncbi:MAG: 2Fe-2S iron-sulfur cluster binding domain-containing protein [Alcanivorax sp.]|nr:2Fe-2S iron-sulfur cluster binding domain-containing protein [Alcanivorax sp.]